MRIQAAARTAAAAAIFAAALAAAAQDEAKPQPDEPQASAPGEHEYHLPPLDELMERALDQNPDIAAARADLQRAETELRRVQMKTVQQLSSLHEQIDALRAMTKELTERAEHGTARFSEVREMATRLAEARAQLEYIIGQSPAADWGKSWRQRDDRPDAPFFEGPHPPFQFQDFSGKRPDAPEKFKAVLDLPVSIVFDETHLSEVLEFISDYLEVNFIVDPEVGSTNISINIRDASLEDALMALSDVGGNVAFVIRDYGIFATTKERAMTIDAPAIPRNLPLRVAGPPDGERRDRIKRIVERRVDDGSMEGDVAELFIGKLLSSEGEYQFNGGTYFEAHMDALMEAVGDEVNSGRSILIRVSEDVPMELLIALLKRFKEAGITNFGVAVKARNEKPERLHIDAPPEPHPSLEMRIERKPVRINPQSPPEEQP